MRHRTIRSIIAMLIAAATITAILIVTLLIFNWLPPITRNGRTAASTMRWPCSPTATSRSPSTST